jgi:hypothetical protein
MLEDRDIDAFLPQLEIEALRLGAKLGRAEPHPYLRVGERVCIKSGLMIAFGGILVRKKNEFRFVLTLEAIMRCVAVEVDASELELVDQPLKEIKIVDDPCVVGIS